MNPSRPVPLESINNLGNVSTRVRGLLYLLASKAGDDEGSFNPPTRQEAEGIIWLASIAGEELTDAVKAVAGVPETSGKGAES